MKMLKKMMSLAPMQTIALVFIVAMIITQVIAYRVYQTEKENELLIVEQQVNHLKNQIEESLSHSITATKMLSYLINNNLLGVHFESISQELLEQNSFIDAIQYVQGNQIINTYPAEGNEPSIGYEVLENTKHRREAMLALERGDLYFEGPFDLIQGGRGIVGRYPIIIDEEYWGFSAVVIRYETILNAIDIDSSGISDAFIYQMIKYSDDEQLNYFFENSEPFDSGVYASSFVSLGNWTLYAKLKNSLYVRNGILFSLIGFLFSVILAVFIGYLAKEPLRLKVLTDKKTQDLNISNKKLEEQAHQLILSNRDLEQFAYVISHDLQEPLRMITSFLSQLEKKYDAVLDEKGKKYIYYAIDGARRMRQIILDLLDYSRIDKIDTEKVAVDTNEVLSSVKGLYSLLIEEKEAELTWAKLPVVQAAESPLQQLFQNLVSNALIYQPPQNKPVVYVWAEETETHWKFFVRDNGIGFNTQYTEKIFTIFQRLHNKEEYSGTGVGLAICKKIIEDHGGKIWVDSEEGSGSTFTFTIAKPENGN